MNGIAIVNPGGECLAKKNVDIGPQIAAAPEACSTNTGPKFNYRKVSNTRRTKSPNLNDSRPVVFAQFIEAECQVDNEDAVGAALTGDIWVIMNSIAH